MHLMHRRRHERRWRSFLLTVLIIACALVLVRYGLVLSAQRGSERQPAITPEQIGIRSDTRLIWITHYTVCSDDDRQETAPGQPLLGMTREQLQAAYPGWIITVFGPTEVELTRTMALCDFHRENRTLKLADGALAVYYGTPASLGPRERLVADVDPTSLTTDDEQALERGVGFFNTDDRALQDAIQAYLEGITE